MINCKVIEITTPRKFILNGLWFGPEDPKKIVIFVHGLSSNVFGGNRFIFPLADHETTVISFSNRGHDTVSRLKKIDKRKKKGYTSITTGAAHEVFTQSADDIQGAVDLAQTALENQSRLPE